MDHRIVCFGDSNTYGYDPRSYLGSRYPSSVRWTALLEAAGWQVINEGENGRCIPQSEQESKSLVQLACHTGAEIVTVMLGSNDLLQQPTPSAEICAARMEKFLDRFLRKMPVSYQILLLTPPPMKPGAWVTNAETLEESRRLAACYKILAQRLGIHFADAGAWGIELAFDGVHFSEQGHRVFAEEIQKLLDQLTPPKKDERYASSIAQI